MRDSAGLSADSARRTPWHAMDAADAAERLGVDPARGLDLDELQARQAQYGPNAIQGIRRRAAWRILLDQFTSLIIALLAVAALISWATRDHAEAIAILVVLILNALVGFLTEYEAGRALDALRRQARTTARVRRSGEQMNVDAVELVPGDVVILNAGNRVPADCRIFEAASLRTEESALTGESVPVNKDAASAPEDASLAERLSMLYLGTTIAAGRAVCLVTAIGIQTELGRIGKLIAEAPVEATPLEIRLKELGRRLVYIVLGIGALVALTGWLRGDGLWVMIEVGISLAVAAVPEALPAVTTLVLALGMLRLARNNAIVRRLPAVETLGSTTIICTDKTGTLTENRMTVREYRLADGRVVDMNGATPSLAGDGLLGAAIRASVLCNEASLTKKNGEARAIGDPTETALLIAADEMGMNVRELRGSFTKALEVPFDAVTKRMITVHCAGDGTRIALLKGAPAVVLDACSQYRDDTGVRPMSDEVSARFRLINEEMADRALRVLALAERTLSGAEEECHEAGSNQSAAEELTPVNNGASQAGLPGLELECGYTLLGFVGMIDPPRAAVLEAVEKARAAGIRVVMLTGDQINTAQAIARELHLSGDEEPLAVPARDLVGAEPEHLATLARKATVFARVSAEDKLRIVEALQQVGEIVAVTGDGINDAPALKRSDIGIAMGQRGTEAAKEAADLVLTDDNFATIIAAIEGGRTIYANIVKFVHLMFSKNLGEVVAIFVSIALGWPLPLLPLQILWMNLVVDVFPAMALAVEPGSPELMRQPPRPPRQSLLSRDFLFLICWQGVLLASLMLAAYWWALQRYGEGAHARTMALMSLVGVQLGHLFNCRSRMQTAFSGLGRNPFVWLAAGIVVALQLSAVYVPALAKTLGTVPLETADWLVAGGTVLAPIGLIELQKWFSRRRSRTRPLQSHVGKTA